MIGTRNGLAAAFLAIGATLAMTFGPSAAEPTKEKSERAFSYPKPRKGDVVDDYHGTQVPDPYRWLEDLDSDETREWIEAENAITNAYLEAIPERERINSRLTELWDYEKFGTPSKEGGRYFYSYNTGLQNQSVLYTVPTLDAEPKVVIDPNTLSEDGTVALTGLDVSDDGTLLCYATSDAGSDWKTWKVREIETGEDRDEMIEWSKFSGASWTKDGSGFFYSRYPEPAAGDNLRAANYDNKLYFHKLGTPQSEDVLIYERPDQKEWSFSGQVTDDGKYLVIGVRRGTDDKNMVLYQDLTKDDAEVVTLIDTFDAGFSLIDNDGSRFWFRTNKDAPRGRVVAINLENPDEENWEVVIPQDPERTLESIGLVGDRFFANYLKDARSQVLVFNLDGEREREVELPGIGTVGGFGGKREDQETFYSFTSFTQPTTIYRYDIPTGESTIFKSPEVPFNPDDYTTEQVFFTSKDGTKIPMFLSYKKGLERNGENPTLLYGYGGFNISIVPSFSPIRLAWMEMGGLYAVPNIRGGGEYGEEWHDLGTKLNKQNVFDDFIAAAEYLIAENWTSTSKLGIEGGSNGGLLVGACITQRPDLFGAALPAVGVLDMLRFHTFTIGYYWTDDYGSPDDPEEFQALYAYSPYHNLKPDTCYPPTMITTADHDDRVFPAHSFKFAAAIQEAQSCDNPVLIRIETRAGHGAGKPTAKVIEEATDKLAFLVKELGLSWEDQPQKREGSQAATRD